MDGDRPLRLITTSPVDRLARTVEALLVVTSQPLSAEELAVAANDDPQRVETALGLLGERFSEGRSGIVLEHVAGGRGGLRPAVRAAGRARALAGGAGDAGDRRVPGTGQPAGDRADPGSRGRLGRGGAAGAGPDRGGRTGGRRRRRGALPDDAALRTGLRARVAVAASAARRPRRRCDRDQGATRSDRRAPTSLGSAPRVSSGRVPWPVPVTSSPRRA